MPARSAKQMLIATRPGLYQRMNTAESEIRRVLKRPPWSTGDAFLPGMLALDNPQSMALWNATPETGWQAILDEAASIASTTNPQIVRVHGIVNETLTMRSNVVIIGQNRLQTIIRQSSAQNTVTFSGVSNTGIFECTVEHRNGNSASELRAIYITGSCDNIVVDDCIVYAENAGSGAATPIEDANTNASGTVTLGS